MFLNRILPIRADVRVQLDELEWNSNFLSAIRIIFPLLPLYHTEADSIAIRQTDVEPRDQ